MIYSQSLQINSLYVSSPDLSCTRSGNKEKLNITREGSLLCFLFYFLSDWFLFSTPLTVLAKQTCTLKNPRIHQIGSYFFCKICLPLRFLYLSSNFAIFSLCVFPFLTLSLHEILHCSLVQHHQDTVSFFCIYFS